MSNAELMFEVDAIKSLITEISEHANKEGVADILTNMCRDLVELILITNKTKDKIEKLGQVTEFCTELLMELNGEHV